jgi:hypothetical protein
MSEKTPMNKILSVAISEICAAMPAYIPTADQRNAMAVIIRDAIERRCAEELLSVTDTRARQREEIHKLQGLLREVVTSIEFDELGLGSLREKITRALVL